MKLKWTKEICKEECLKHNSKIELLRSKPSCYNVVSKNKWFEELCSHMNLGHKKYGYWSKERCKEESMKYDTRTQFKTGSNAAYYNSIKNGWLDELCQNYLTPNNILFRDIYAIVGVDSNSIYIGLSCNPIKRYDTHKKRPTQNVKELINSSHELIILQKKIPSTLAGKVENDYIEEFKRKGFNVLNQRKGGNLGRKIEKWDKNKIQELARSVSSRKEFYSKYGSAAKWAAYTGCLQEILIHLPNKNESTLMEVNNEVLTPKELSLKYNVKSHIIKQRYKRGLRNTDLIK